MYKSFCEEKTEIPENQHAVKIGDKFGKLTVISKPYWRERTKRRNKKYAQKYQFVECLCDCGQNRTCIVSKLKINQLIHCQKCATQSAISKRQKGGYTKNGKKQCCVCYQQLDIKCFYKNNFLKDGLNSRCKNCHYIHRIKQTHNIDISHLIGKKVRCEICKKRLYMPNESSKLNVVHLDHNHITEKIRGILCRNCNSLIGLSGESLDTLNESIKYLQKYN